MELAELYKEYLSSEGVSTDSRSVGRGQIFFALKGPAFDGNSYASNALEKGAALAIVDAPEVATDDRYVLVEDVLTTLQNLASHHRNQLDISIISIVGSNGKTTTKELLYAILQTQYKTGVTSGNLNNEIGVPLTLLSFPPDTGIAIVEMGARYKGDIAFLCGIAEPTHGIITNAGKDHMETFKTIDNVIQTNAELFEHLKRHAGTAFIKKEYGYLTEAANGISEIIYYGEESGVDCHGSLISANPFIRFSYRWKDATPIEISSQLIGRFNLENLLAAVCIGKYFGISDDNIRAAISAYTPRNNRSQLIRQNSNTIILDAYNANPTSMKGAIDSFAELPSKTKIVIMGDMLELGEHSNQEHQDMLNYALSKGFSQVVLVGKEFEKVYRGTPALHFPDNQYLKDWLHNQHWQDAHILVKGSRGIALEKAFDL